MGVRNVIGVTRGLWLATWLLQVMPLFFFVGGFSNLKTYESMRARGERISTYWRTRYERLMAPTWIFVGIWLAIQAIMHLAGVGGSGIARGGLLPFGPLWFLLVYFGVIFLAPVAIALHRRFRLWIPAALLAIVVVADLLRFGSGVPKIGWINLGAVAAGSLAGFLLRGRRPRENWPPWATGPGAPGVFRPNRPDQSASTRGA